MTFATGEYISGEYMVEVTSRCAQVTWTEVSLQVHGGSPANWNTRKSFIEDYGSLDKGFHGILYLKCFTWIKVLLLFAFEAKDRAGNPPRRYAPPAVKGRVPPSTRHGRWALQWHRKTSGRWALCHLSVNSTLCRVLPHTKGRMMKGFQTPRHMYQLTLALGGVMGSEKITSLSAPTHHCNFDSDDVHDQMDGRTVTLSFGTSLRLPHLVSVDPSASCLRLAGKWHASHASHRHPWNSSWGTRRVSQPGKSTKVGALDIRERGLLLRSPDIPGIIGIALGTLGTLGALTVGGAAGGRWTIWTWEKTKACQGPGGEKQHNTSSVLEIQD